MTQLVGILNLTPDSFSDGGQFIEPEVAIAHARQLFEDGASLLDVGAESTNPKSQPITPEEEWRRLEPVLRALIPAFPGKISLDTHHAETVERAFAIGPVIVNDVTGLNDRRMLDVVAKLQARVIVSHLPKMSIAEAHHLAPVTTVQRVKAELLETVAALRAKEVPDERIILDPGIGFGKTMELNAKLLRFAEEVPQFKVMIGYSRKRFLGEHRMEPAPNLAAGKTAIASGAAYLRVHDVAGHAELVKRSSNSPCQMLGRMSSQARSSKVLYCASYSPAYTTKQEEEGKDMSKEEQPKKQGLIRKAIKIALLERYL